MAFLDLEERRSLAEALRRPGAEEAGARHLAAAGVGPRTLERPAGLGGRAR